MTLKQLAEQLIDEMPNASSRGLARELVERYPQHFATVERARSMVRLIRGATGDKVRQFASRPNNSQSAPRMPRSIAKPRAPFKAEPVDTLIISDLHVPFHAPEAIELALGYAEPKQIIINGDLIDFVRLSRFVHPANAPSVEQEISATRQFLEFLRGSYPEIPVIYKTGNHEERLQDYMYTKAPDVSQVARWRLADLLGLDDLGITIVEDKRIVQLAGLNILHGHELSRGFVAPVNPARGAFLKAAVNVLIGHHHRSSQHDERDALGKITSCWSTGCLCDLSPDYNPYGKSNHGFAFVRVESPKRWRVENLRIIEGVIC
jgi:predicted phosphodiesterase